MPKYQYDIDHEIGENNIQLLGMDVHNPVFFDYAVRGRHLDRAGRRRRHPRGRQGMDARTCTLAVQQQHRDYLRLLHPVRTHAVRPHSHRGAFGEARVRHAVVACDVVLGRCRYRAVVLGCGGAARLFLRVVGYASQRRCGNRRGATPGNERNDIPLGTTPLGRLRAYGAGARLLHV